MFKGTDVRDRDAATFGGKPGTHARTPKIKISSLRQHTVTISLWASFT